MASILFCGLVLNRTDRISIQVAERLRSAVVWTMAAIGGVLLVFTTTVTAIKNFSDTTFSQEFYT